MEVVEQVDFYPVLKDVFHLSEFRPGQLEALTTLWQQRKLICIQPTGHGKSLLYQLTACLLPGVTLVISPLLALMRDQMQQLNSRFNIKSASINSDQSDDENEHTERQLKDNKIKILFVSPEKLDHVYYFDLLKSLNINLIVVDEAHCISTWGHDFRPSYRRIITFVHAMEKAQSDCRVLAVTATANKKVEQDIQKQFSSTDLVPVQRQSMDRPNLILSCLTCDSVSEKLAHVKSLVSTLEGVGIIYCATRENVELVAEYLKSENIYAAAYHAGFDSEVKKELQADFLANKFKVIAATNALGMGIDKQDLRFIIHFDMPGSITAYYQEVGRCGRDGLDAQGFLLFQQDDIKIQQHFIESAQPTKKDFDLIRQTLKSSEVLLRITDIKRATGLHSTRINVVIAALIEQGFVAKKTDGRKQVYHLTQKQGEPELLRFERQRQVRMGELNQMTAYAENKQDCLMQLLRMALGDNDAKKCGHCGVCLPQAVTNNNKDVEDIYRWLSLRSVPIRFPASLDANNGLAILDGKQRSPLFIEFMRSRVDTAIKLNDNFYKLLGYHLNRLCANHPFTAVVVLPSKSWLQRESLSKYIADKLKQPLFLNELVWKEDPASKQGLLHNTDQRRFNVNQKMKARLNSKLQGANILLIDDYTGSGWTLREAARCLRKVYGPAISITPLTIAAVKWKIGQAGMV